MTPLCMSFAALVAIAGIAGQWSAANGFPLWRFGAGLLLLGLWWEWWRVRRYALRGALATTPLRLGRTEALALTIENGARRSLVVEFAPLPPASLEGPAATRRAMVPARQPHRQSLAVRATRLGSVRWPALPTRVRGPLGLAWWNRRLPLDAELTVVPDTVGRGAAPAGNAVDAGRLTLPGGGDELDHLRPYRPGDARRMIDWKATARSGALVTRLTREQRHLAVMLVVDAGRTSRTRIDGLSQLGHYVNACARFAERAVANHDSVGLVTVADQPLASIPPGRGPSAVTRIRKALGELSESSAETDLLPAALAVKALVSGRCLIVLLTDLYGQSASGRLMRCVRAWVPKHLPIVAGLIAEDVERMAAAPAEGWLDPYLALAAADYRRNLRANAAGLQRIGACPLIARAATLEASVVARYRSLRAQGRV